MDAVYFLVQQMMFFSIPLLIVALGGMFSERSGVVNIALEGIMVAGAFTSILMINALQAGMSGQGLLLLAILVAVVTGALFSLLHAYAAISLRSDQTISGTALNMIAPASAIYLARMIQPNGVQQIEFTNTFRIAKVSLLGDIPVLGPLLFQNAYITESSSLPLRPLCCTRHALACGCAPAASIPRPRTAWGSMSIKCATRA